MNLSDILYIILAIIFIIICVIIRMVEVLSSANYYEKLEKEKNKKQKDSFRN